jgi:hypothetical protein
MRVVISNFQDQTAFVLQVKRIGPKDRPTRSYSKAVMSLVRVVEPRGEMRQRLRLRPEPVPAMRENRVE